LRLAPKIDRSRAGAAELGQFWSGWVEWSRGSLSAAVRGRSRGSL